MSEPALSADCTRCNGLCCVYLAFDRSELFALDKPAATPCPHLTDGCLCAIHSDLAHQGFAGCVRYDCLGAGQRVVQELFGGRSWRESQAVAAAMFSSFSTMRIIHELLLLLRYARTLPLTCDQAELCRELERALMPDDGWSQSSLDAFERSDLAGEVKGFLRSLKQQALGVSA